MSSPNTKLDDFADLSLLHLVTLDLLFVESASFAALIPKEKLSSFGMAISWKNPDGEAKEPIPTRRCGSTPMD